MQQSLSLAMIALGEERLAPILQRAITSEDPAVKAHAAATEQLLRNPEAGFQYSVDQVKRIFAPG